MAFGDADLSVFFADFGVPVTFGGVTVNGNWDTPLDSINFGGGPSSMGRQKFAIALPVNAFPRRLRMGDAITVDGSNYIVKAPLLSVDGLIATYDLESS